MAAQKKEKNILMYVGSIPVGASASIRAWEKKIGRTFRIMLVRDTKTKSRFGHASDFPDLDILVSVDLKNDTKIVEALLPYQDELLAVSCRSESNMMQFARIIPHIPYVRTPTPDSLVWATDKLQMRRRFKLFAPKLTPKFARVRDAGKKERKRIIEKVGFPMIVKPANLTASMLVTICYHEEELEKVLKNIFRKINKTHTEQGVYDVEPKIMAEEFIEGEMYSVDSYVNSRGDVYHCPLVRVKTGREIGHDDFYSYMAITPTRLKKETIARAEAATEEGIHALGLRNSTVHTELMKVDDEWKLVEAGPRVGGFRVKLHELSCDIDHSLNDMLIRIPKRPVVPKKCKGFAATLKWFPQKEGVITEMKGIKKIETLDSYHDIIIRKKIGDRATFARNGGKSIFNVTLYNKERSVLLADIRRLEQFVEIKVENGRSGNGGGKKVEVKKVGKKVVKKTVKKTAKKVVKKVRKG